MPQVGHFIHGIDGLALNPSKIPKSAGPVKQTKHRVERRLKPSQTYELGEPIKMKHMSNPRTSGKNSAKPCSNLPAVEMMVGRNRRSRAIPKGNNRTDP
jgi:hypothetical protein